MAYTNNRLKKLLKRIREDSPKGGLLNRVAMKMQRELFLEEIENKYPPFRGKVRWIRISEGTHVQAQTKEKV